MSRPPMKVKGQPRVIFLDAAGTLIHPTRPVGETYAEAAQRFGAQTSAEEMDAAFRQVWKEQPPRAPSAQAREGDDRPWWRALAFAVLDQAARRPAGFDRTGWFDSLYEYFSQPAAWELYPEVKEVLSEFHGQVRLAVISNFDGRLRRILAGHGLADDFERLIISSEVGCEKPSPEIFHQACATMAVSPGECWHAGDDPERDWAGATAAGLVSFHLRRPTTTLHDLVAQWREIVKPQAAS